MGEVLDEGVLVPGDRARSELLGNDFERFFEQVWPRAVALAERVGVDSGEAQDVALDGLAITYDRWRRVSRLPYREGWALRVVANLALRHVKRQRRRSWIDNRIVLGPVEQDVASRLVVRDALAALPRRQREVLCLRYLADMSEADVAATLGIDVGSVKQHASRGRHGVKDLLTNVGGDHAY